MLQRLYAHRKKESHPVLHEGNILLIENFYKSKAIKPSLVLEKKLKVFGNDPQSKRIKVKREEGTRDSKSIKKSFKQESNKKNVEEITESKNSDNDDKMEMGDLSSNLD